MRNAVLWCAALALAGNAAAQSLPDGPGRELFETICSECHEPTKVIGQHKSREEWQAKVTEMLQEDQDVTQQEREIIVNYLAASFPQPAKVPAKVNVNKAAAADLEAALDLSGKDAQAIVRYRSEKGNFKTLDDLKKVPGLDPAAVDSWKDRLEF
jgi:competence protein ComEA